MTKEQKTQILRDLRQMVEVDMPGTFGEVIAFQALATLEDLYAEELSNQTN
jgi:hypothetical protein